MNIKSPRILLVDNYDSFTWNLVQIIEEHGGCSFEVMKNDEVIISSAAEFDGFLFSPGPGIPQEAPIMSDLLRAYQDKKSFLGICLGHQAIAEFFGMKLIKLSNVRHGQKTIVKVIDSSDYLFNGIPQEFEAGLYHSWAIGTDDNDPGSVSDLRVTALGSDGIIMAVAHITFDIRGIQFHPESCLSEYGQKIIHNWIDHLPIR